MADISACGAEISTGTIKVQARRYLNGRHDMKWQSSSMRLKTLWLSWGCLHPDRHARGEGSQRYELASVRNVSGGPRRKVTNNERKTDRAARSA